MLKTLAYPLVIERHETDGGYLAYFPSLPGCQTWGETYEAAVQNAEEALAVYIETLTANGDPVPEPAPIEGIVALGVMVRADVAA
ncbi:MAG: type II toxin-antitoxin system HicB family antitoxin [Methylocystis silviterrae]|jgi:antitoxin HicB